MNENIPIPETDHSDSVLEAQDKLVKKYPESETLINALCDVLRAFPRSVPESLPAVEDSY